MQNYVRNILGKILDALLQNQNLTFYLLTSNLPQLKKLVPDFVSYNILTNLPNTSKQNNILSFSRYVTFENIVEFSYGLVNTQPKVFCLSMKNAEADFS